MPMERGYFFALEKVYILLERHNLQVRVVVLQQLQDKLSVVVTHIVYHNHLEIRIVLLK